MINLCILVPFLLILICFYLLEKYNNSIIYFNNIYINNFTKDVLSLKRQIIKLKEEVLDNNKYKDEYQLKEGFPFFYKKINDDETEWLSNPKDFPRTFLDENYNPSTNILPKSHLDKIYNSNVDNYINNNQYSY